MVKIKSKYYNSKRIREEKARYNIIFGERSNGKTWDFCYEALKDFCNSGRINQAGIIRRWDEDFTNPNGAKTMYNGLACDGNSKNQILKLTGGEFDTIQYYSGRYYLGNTDEKTGKITRSDLIVAYAFSISASASDHYKSASFPNIKWLLFDEFITRDFYIKNEFIHFMNLISTIVRDRDDVTVFMLGNTVNRYCPYFREMGITRIMKMKQGDIDVYTYGESSLRVAVEYVKSAGGSGKKSDVYFAFDNPRLKMITSGEWEIGMYPHLEIKYLPKDVKYTFFIQFERDLLQCEIIQLTGQSPILFIHPKTTDLKRPDEDLIYHTGYSHKRNWRRRLTDATLPIEKKIMSIIFDERVFYADNETGEVMRNYLIWCKKS